MTELDPLTDLDWLATTTFQALPDEIRRRLEEARGLGIEEGYRRGHEAGLRAGDLNARNELAEAMERVRSEAQAALDQLRDEIAERVAASFERGREEGEALVAEMRGQLSSIEAHAYRQGQLEAESRLGEEMERQVKDLEAAMAEEERRRADANLREAEERVLAFERALRDREQAIEDRVRKELALEPRRPGAPSKQALDEAYQRGLREGSVVKAAGDNSRLEAARKQAYQSGFEHGLAKGRRDAEAPSQAQVEEARRQGYYEGLSEGRRSSLGIEGSRSWALGVMHLPDEATLDDVRQRFRKLSLMMHPDQNPGLGDAFIKNLTRARDILGG